MVFRLPRGSGIRLSTESSNTSTGHRSFPALSSCICISYNRRINHGIGMTGASTMTAASTMTGASTMTDASTTPQGRSVPPQDVPVAPMEDVELNMDPHYDLADSDPSALNSDLFLSDEMSTPPFSPSHVLNWCQISSLFVFFVRHHMYHFSSTILVWPCTTLRQIMLIRMDISICTKHNK